MLIFQGDPRFALVKWKTSKPLFSVIPMADFVKADTYTLKNEYTVNYNDGKSIRKYKSVLLFIGNEKKTTVI